jgi:hypothetical protein
MLIKTTWGVVKNWEIRMKREQEFERKIKGENRFTVCLTRQQSNYDTIAECNLPQTMRLSCG